MLTPPDCLLLPPLVSARCPRLLPLLAEPRFFSLPPLVTSHWRGLSLLAATTIMLPAAAALPLPATVT